MSTAATKRQRPDKDPEIKFLYGVEVVLKSCASKNQANACGCDEGELVRLTVMDSGGGDGLDQGSPTRCLRAPGSPQGPHE